MTDTFTVAGDAPRFADLFDSDLPPLRIVSTTKTAEIVALNRVIDIHPVHALAVALVSHCVGGVLESYIRDANSTAHFAFVCLPAARPSAEIEARVFCSWAMYGYLLDDDLADVVELLAAMADDTATHGFATIGASQLVTAVNRVVETHNRKMQELD